MKSKSARAIWADGMSEAMKRLKPKNVIDFGGAKVTYFKARQFGEGRNE